jgi:hypothetical protein
MAAEWQTPHSVTGPANYGSVRGFESGIKSLKTILLINNESAILGSEVDL